MLKKSKRNSTKKWQMSMLRSLHAMRCTCFDEIGKSLNTTGGQQHREEHEYKLGKDEAPHDII